jgi:5-oxoprolinase (ATP-hydrolysing) subunit B
MVDASSALPPPLIQPLGDRGLIVRFSATLSDEANRATIAFAGLLREALPAGVGEIDPNLVSVLLRYDPRAVTYEQLAGEVRLLLGRAAEAEIAPERHCVRVQFGGDAGPDLASAAESLGLTPDAFVVRHNASPLRVLTTGFAPGFVYCGFHGEDFALPRRTTVRQTVPAGTVLFAARQTAITATPIPTGWHVIGHTEFTNFDAHANPPTQLREGDEIAFEAVA